MEWCRAYRTNGLAALVDKRMGGNRAKLLPTQIEELRARLHTYPPADLFGDGAGTVDGQFWTVPDLRGAMKRWYEVSYQSPSSYFRYFQLCEFSYQRPAKVYKSRCEAQVIEFESALEKN